MHVTVAICTWNRADLLDKTLRSLTKVIVPQGVSWKVVVANNNSTDHTAEILNCYTKLLPLSQIFVSEQGKSYALNEIVDRLQGDLVLWTDDDVRVDRNWIVSYVDAAKLCPEASFFGGYVIPCFLSDEPDWLRPNWKMLSSVYAARELGDQPFVFDRGSLPFGANMAVRVDLQKQYRYDPELGRRGELLLSGEETDLMQRWLTDGYVGRWVPESRIEHLITPDRVKLDHIRRYFFSLAESKRPQGKAASMPSRLMYGAWYAARAFNYHLKNSIPLSSFKDRRIKYLVRTSYCWGRVEAQWNDLPQWLKPRQLRRLKQHRSQPRFVMSKIAANRVSLGQPKSI